MIEFVAVIILVVWFFLNVAYTDKALRELDRIKCIVDDIEVQNMEANYFSRRLASEKSEEGKT